MASQKQMDFEISNDLILTKKLFICIYNIM